MKPLLLILLFICYCTNTNAQENYLYVDSKALQIPQSKTYSTDSIAQYVNDNFTKGKEKIRAVYTWVINNIEYSKDSINHFNRWGIDPEINMSAILRRRKGVCENYAALFANILVKCGVQAVAVTGYTNIPANNYWNGHGWVAVQADKEWFLCDPTWDAGYNSYKYFLVKPDEFIETHIPFDPLWQLLEHPVSHKNFQRGHFSTKKDTTVFHYKDSVAAYLLSDTLQQMQAGLRRMQQSGFDNEDVKTWHSFNQMKVHIVQQEENMQLFNEAVADLNKAKKLYTEFVDYRNNQFTPLRLDEDIKGILSNAEQLLSSSYKRMNEVGKKAENYQYDTDSLKDSLDNLSSKVKTQQEFLKKYFASAETERQKLFYQ
jgi:ribosomal 50S subunit-associated protein YjgA (DUF615 family)